MLFVLLILYDFVAVVIFQLMFFCCYIATRNHFRLNVVAVVFGAYKFTFCTFCFMSDFNKESIISYLVIMCF